MHWERRTNKTYVGLYCGYHEDTLLCIELAPRFSKNHIGFCIGFSLLYLTLFSLEWVWFRKTIELPAPTS